MHTQVRGPSSGLTVFLMVRSAPTEIRYSITGTFPCVHAQ
jgi:hypothetical protein